MTPDNLNSLVFLLGGVECYMDAVMYGCTTIFFVVVDILQNQQTMGLLKGFDIFTASYD